jgi:hypothetical protein
MRSPSSTIALARLGLKKLNGLLVNRNISSAAMITMLNNWDSKVFLSCVSAAVVLVSSSTISTTPHDRQAKISIDILKMVFKHISF